MAQVIRPIIPYLGTLYDGIHEGKKIKLSGVVPYGADRFTVNLMAGDNLDSADRPLHISVRFEINTVVRNHFHKNSWGAEERSGPFPFAIGSPFTILILVQASGYQISVNDHICWNFAHRLPFTRASSIFINGDVSIERIEYINKPMPQVVYPVLAPANRNEVSLGSVLPCVFPIHGGVKPGMLIYISGRPAVKPHRFSFNIQKGASTHPPPDVAFHFDVRFYNYSIVRNSRLNSIWYSEETMVSHFPFQPGHNFDVLIKIQSDMYVVMVNGQHFVSFRHRLNTLSDFNVLSIENDAIITSIKCS